MLAHGRPTDLACLYYPMKAFIAELRERNAKPLRHAVRHYVLLISAQLAVGARKARTLFFFFVRNLEILPAGPAFVWRVKDMTEMKNGINL